VREVLIVQDCVEYQSVSAEGLAAVDRVIPKQKHVALAQVRVHDDSVLGNL